jgi:hypothetical protein
MITENCREWYNEPSNRQFDDFIRFLHRFHWFWSYATAMLSGLFLAEMSIDRLIAVRFPMSAPRLCTTSRAKKIVAVTTVVFTVLNLNTFFTHEYVKNKETGKSH